MSIAKLFEKCIKIRLIYFLNEHIIIYIFNGNQFGFRNKLFINDALYCVTKFIYDNRDLKNMLFLTDIPQGTILGPLVFIKYINGFQNQKIGGKLLCFDNYMEFLVSNSCLHNLKHETNKGTNFLLRNDLTIVY